MRENVIFDYLGLPYITCCLIWLALFPISCTFLEWSWSQSSITLNNILLGMCTTFSLSIHSLMDIRLIPCLRIWECNNKYVCISVSVVCCLIWFEHVTRNYKNETYNTSIFSESTTMIALMVTRVHSYINSTCEFFLTCICTRICYLF